MDWTQARRFTDGGDDEDKSISSESSGGGNQVPSNNHNQNIRVDLDIWDTCEIGITLGTLPNSEEAHAIILLCGSEFKEIAENCDESTLNVALLLACWNSCEDAVSRLLTTKCDVNVTDALGRTPMHFACLSGDFQIVKLLLRHNAKAHVWDRAQKATPLHCAASAGSIECIQILLKNGAQINSGIEKKSALHYAVQRNSVRSVKLLLESGADPNTPQVYTETPLHVAAAAGHLDCMRLLLDHGADVRSQFGLKRFTALHLAAEDDFYECVKLLLDRGANINAVNADNQTPLHTACLSQAVEAVGILIQYGANVNAIYKDGRTALHAAIVKESRFWDCARLLLEARVDANRADNFGYTPLHIAALNEFSSCVMLLLDFGADLTARTNGGSSALSFIVRRTPEVIPKYVQKFDSAIKVNDHEIGDVDCEIKLDFRILVPHIDGGETELLLTFIEVGQKHVLKHPLCETFLFLKWRRIRKFFLFSLLFHSVFVLLFTIYILGVYVRDCTKGEGITEANDCLAAQYIVPVGYAVLLVNMILLLKELFQMAHGFYSYVRYWENWLQWLIILGIFFCSNPQKLISHDISQVPKWQHHVAALVIFLVWLELMMLVGRFPIFGLYVQMFTTVAVNFSKFLGAYCCLLVAFGLSFAVLFPNYPAFNYVPWAILKTIIMMAGELEFEDIFYPNEQIKYPVTSHFVFFGFVLLITIILTNLMVGLAVSDIQGLQASAGLDRLSRQAELVSRLESFLFSRLLNKVPSRLIAWCRQKALLRASRHHLQFWVKPNDPREKRVPRDIIVSIFKLAAERRDRNQTMKHKKSRQDMAMLNEYFDTVRDTRTYSDVELRNHPTLNQMRQYTVSEITCNNLRSRNEITLYSIQKQLEDLHDTQRNIITKLNGLAKEISNNLKKT